MEIITTHLHADFDGLASMIAARKLYPGATLAFSGSQEKSVRDFFAQSDKYLYDFQRSKNIPLDQVSRLILVDTRHPGRLGPFAECLNNPGLDIHIFDHHPEAPGDLAGSFQVIRPVGATATIFAEIFQERNIPVTPEEATILGIAIHEDTGSFTFETTTPADLAAMAWLLGQGAQLNTIAQFVSQELSADEVALLHDLIKSAVTYTIQGIGIVVAKLSLSEYVDDFALLARRFMMMENLDALFAFGLMDNRLYLVARSRIPEVNAGKIAGEFGGGGHASAASAAIKDMTLIEAEEKLLLLLHRYVQPQSIAREVMSAPVIYVRPDITIADANTALTRYSLTVLPVLEDDRRVVGLISRRVTEKSIFLGLGDQPVGDYMTSDFVTLPPSATLADIQELIIEHRQRFIPVVEDDALKGVITRTDLLHLLVNDPANLPKNLLAGKHLPSVERHRNLTTLMTGSLTRETIVLLRTIGEVAKDCGCTAYVVGGFVRDLLLHTPSLDLDIVIEGDGIAFARSLAAKLSGSVRTHEKFSTAVVILSSGMKIDVATARLEYYEYPAAMPTVELSSIKLDLYRRDFTINALAIHLNPERFGTLVDFFNCQNDIKDRQIRVLHSLSFVEDPTRILRAIRFEQRMNFTIGKHAEKLIKNAIRMKAFNHFCGRRFFVELQAILSEENPISSIERMSALGVLRFFLEDMKLDQGMRQILAEAQRAVAWRRLLYLDDELRQWQVYLLALLTYAPVEKIKEFNLVFEVPERHARFLEKEKPAAQKISRILNRHPQFRNSAAYRLFVTLSPAALLYLMALTRKKSGKKAISHFVTHLRHVRPELTGDDLMAMGYQPGPIFKTILNRLLDARLDNLVLTKDDEAAFVRATFPVGMRAATEKKTK